MPLTTDAYTDGNWSQCPNCEGIGTTEAGTSEADENWVLIHVACNACNAAWDDVYTLTSYANLATEEV